MLRRPRVLIHLSRSRCSLLEEYLFNRLIFVESADGDCDFYPQSRYSTTTNCCVRCSLTLWDQLYEAPTHKPKYLRLSASLTVQYDTFKWKKVLSSVQFYVSIIHSGAIIRDCSRGKKEKEKKTGKKRTDKDKTNCFKLKWTRLK